jgi:type I restriction-modification system DNA methylase subunit
MPLSWNEIRQNALTFSKEWENETSEDAEAQSFWNEFFNVFGISRRRVASFEKPVKKSDGKDGYIDLLWKGWLVVEHKSRGKDLDRAYKQATDYFAGLKERDLPRYVLVSDFGRFRLYDIDENKTAEFPIKDLHKNIKHFAFIAGYQTQKITEQEEAVNVKAASQLGQFHDLIKDIGYTGHALEVLLVRILFCLFAEDTGIFEKNQFREYLEQRTVEDGSDLGMHLTQLFQILNTPLDKRQKTLDEQLADFPYVNGKLFEETLPGASFDRKMRETLLDAAALDWSQISPAIFGSLFQSIMDKQARRNLGAHYTREANILKALKPLFLDDLHDELESIGQKASELVRFQNKLRSIRILDPACGCGNFLVISYRELRLLELEVLKRLHRKETNRLLDVKGLLFVDVDQFYGIEIEEFPAQIAQVALWLTDHQMNMKVSEEFGQYFARLPLKKSPHIVHGNALRMNLEEVVKPAELSYIVGNPPFIGSKMLNEAQSQEMEQIFHDVEGAGNLDYVSAWYKKAATFMLQNKNIRAAFVSTNSITQGEQVGVLWSGLVKMGVRIHFAHRTFQWSNEARGVAAVHCVIIGFSLAEIDHKRLFDYDSLTSEPHEISVKNINPYLVDAPNILIQKRSAPICDVPEIKFGNQPIDGGHLILSTEEKETFIKKSHATEALIRKYLGAEEFINGTERWCLWINDISPNALKEMPQVLERLEKVRQFRLSSKRPATRDLAAIPSKFAFISHEDVDYLLIPSVSSEKRNYIPIGFMAPHVIASNLCLIIPKATLFHFGILNSTMHMSWVRSVCGRLKSDYRYSNSVVYNNFPWPEATDKQRQKIEKAAQGVLDTRAKYPKSTLADLYNATTMPPDLVKAHNMLDRAVDEAYGKASFKNEAERVAFLFGLYQKITSPLALDAGKKKPGKKKAR